MQMIRDVVILLILILVLTTFRISPLPEIEIEQPQVHAASSEANTALDELGRLILPDGITVRPAGLGLQPSQAPDEQPERIPLHLFPTPSGDQGQKPVLEEMNDPKFHCRKSPDGTRILVICSSTKT